MGGWIKGLAIIVGGIIALIVVAWLALLRPDIAFDKLEDQYFTAADQRLDLGDGLLVHYRDQGPRGAPVLVMVHGFSASLYDWEPWVARLDRRYRIISLDLPGHGLTRAPASFTADQDHYADLVAAVTERLGAQRFVLIGNSMGGGVAWDFALRHPERLDGLVLVDAAGFQHSLAQQKSPIVFKILRSRLGRAILRDIDIKPLIAQGLKSAFVDERLVTPALVERYADFARAPGHRNVLLALQTQNRVPATPQRLAAITAPTLVMHGEQDHLVPFADGQAFAKDIPGATLDAYPGVGHVPMEQIPDASARDLDAWLRARVYPGR